jgi:glycerol-3-phosphate dehydrogenase (NAD(P)+)
MIGKGYSVKSAQLEMSMIAEGYYATECIHKTNENLGVEMPIADFAYKILYKSLPLKKELQELSDSFK